MSLRGLASGVFPALWVLSACSPVEPSTPAAVAPPASQAAASASLEREAWLLRASVDLRGFRPTPDERRRFETTEDASLAALDAWLASEAFAQRVGDWYAAVYRSRIDAYPYVEDYEDDATRFALVRAIGNEIPALVTWLVLNDRPFSELVRADVSFVEPSLLDLWPLARAEGDLGRLPPETVPVRYTDGRPAAGVLSTNAFYWRFPSTVENANRGRANALARALLCEDYLERPIDFPKDIDLTDSESITFAVRTEPACLGCHATMDPLASHLWGFMHRNDQLDVWRTYHPAQEQDWRRETRRAPSFFGVQTESLSDLGSAISRDPRFVNCAVEQVWRQLMGRKPALADDADVATHREVFLASGLRIAALTRSIVTSAAYRGVVGRGAFGPLAAPLVDRLISAEQLADTLAALTGYRLTFAGREAIDLDIGLRTVAGSSDHGASPDPSTGLVLVHRRLAEGAARSVLTALAADASPDAPPLVALLAETPLDEAPSEALLAELFSLVLGREAASDAVTALGDVYSDALLVSRNPREAWHALLTALLSDPELLFH